MARITFKAKAYAADARVYTDDPADPHTRIDFPELARRHCDMGAFRTHPKYGAYANSDLFPAMLSRIRRDLAPRGYLRLDRLPEGVTVDASGFLAVVRIEV